MDVGCPGDIELERGDYEELKRADPPERPQLAYYEFLWTDEIIDHLAEHGVSPDDFERIVCHSKVRGHSRSSDDPAAWGILMMGGTSLPSMN